MINTGCATVFMWVCNDVYTILLKVHQHIAAIHILFMISKVSGPSVMQLAVPEHVRVDKVKLWMRFLAHPFLSHLEYHTV